MSTNVTEGDLKRLDRCQGRRRILLMMAACGAAGPSLLAFGEALAAAPADIVAQLTILIQGGPVGDALKAIANPMFAAIYLKATVELSTPGKFPAFAGTPADVAEQILAARAQWGLNGILFRLPLWEADEMLQVRPVFDLLARAGAWVPPEARAFSW